MHVSIIIPCYNAGPWLAETLESALAQTWPDKEIIVVNDGSRDNSLGIARGFAARGVTVIDQPNRGGAAARNRGLEVARGAFVQFLDADDLLTPDKIAAQVELLADWPSGTLATCAWGRFERDPRAARFVDDSVYQDFAALDFLLHCADTGTMMHPAAWLVPRAVAANAGPWNETLSLNDDGEYFCRVVLASSGLAFSRTGRSLYRSGLADSLSQRRSLRARHSQFRSIELIEAHLLATEDSPRTRRAAANHYQRFIHDFFPRPADLMQAAERRIALLGGSTRPEPAMGPRTRLLARVFGWRNVWRAKDWLHR